MLLTGTFTRAVDDKQRIALPKRLREALEQVGPQGRETPALFLTPGTDNSLALYTEDSLTALARRLADASPTRQDVRAFNRLFYARAERLELDEQGRFRIPPSLAQLASLGKEVVVVGVQDHLEIWDKDKWDAYLASQASQYDQVAEQAFSPQV
jgi:MraZ protein